MLLRELKISRKNYLIKVIDVYHLMLYPYYQSAITKKINIILKKFYVEKIINATIKKNTMRKLMKDTCKKTVIVFDIEIYKQIHGFGLGSPLPPVLANIIMNELESTIIKKLVDTRESFNAVTSMIHCY